MNIETTKFKNLIIAAWEAGFLSRDKEQQKIKTGKSTALEDNEKFKYADRVMKEFMPNEIALKDVVVSFYEKNQSGTAIVNGKEIKVKKYIKQDSEFSDYDSDIKIDDDKKLLTDEERDELYEFLNDEADW